MYNDELLRPANWDEIQPHSERKPPAGYYIMRIINVVLGTTKKNDKILRFELDIAEGEYQNYYTDISASYNKCLLLKYGQLCEKDSAMAYFKKIITDIEKSNFGYKFDFNCNSLRGKLVGAFTYYENYKTNDGQVREAMKIDKFLTVGEVRELMSKKIDIIETDTNMSKKLDDEYNKWKKEHNEDLEDDDLPF